jgi:hypothetical protein
MSAGKICSCDDVNACDVMYGGFMKRLQISIEEEMDDALSVEAGRRKTSKAALIREFVRDRLGDGGVDDSMSKLIGDIDDEAGDIDRVIYES